MLYILFFSIFFIQSKIILCDTININDQRFAIYYLKQYGYLEEESDDQLFLLNDTLVTHAISMFQQFYNLPGNGKLNLKTKEFMNHPRCGVKDFTTTNYSPIRHKWPKTHITWTFFLGDIKHVQVSTKAFEYWSNISSLTFERVTWNPDIIISYKDGLHGFTNPKRQDFCTSSFDGPGNVLAHAYYPSGEYDHTSEVHIDSAESWFIELQENHSDNPSLLQILIHEIGHALGLEHSTRNDSIMFPFLIKMSYPPKLGIEDIHRIKNLYGTNKWKSNKNNFIPPATTSITTITTSTTETTNKIPDLCALHTHIL